MFRLHTNKMTVITNRNNQVGQADTNRNIETSTKQELWSEGYNPWQESEFPWKKSNLVTVQPSVSTNRDVSSGIANTNRQ